MSKVLGVYKGVAGINNKVAPERQAYDFDAETVTSLEAAVDVFIDETGAVVSRGGEDRIISGSFHSLYKVESGFLVAEDRENDCALKHILIEDGAVKINGIKSGLAKGARFSYCEAGSKVLYTNGFQNGSLTQMR